MSIFHDGVETLVQKSFRRLTPFFVPYIITNMGGALLAIDLGFSGPNYSISTACATSNYCIHAAAQQIEHGSADLMLCGGAEAPMTPIGLAGFVACRALSTRNDAPQKASRPWDRDRDGFVMGEGSGVLLLESLDHALQRGAPIYAEYLGGSVNCDAYHMTDPRADGAGVGRCMDEALKHAGVSPQQVNYINAHADVDHRGRHVRNQRDSRCLWAAYQKYQDQCDQVDDRPLPGCGRRIRSCSYDHGDEDLEIAPDDQS